MLNSVDVALLLVIVGGSLAGAKRGFIHGTLDLFRWGGCLLLGLRFYPAVANLMGMLVSLDDTWLLPMAFFLVVLFSGVILSFLESLVLERVHPDTHLSTFNRVMGMVPGALNGVIVVAIMAVLLLAIPLPNGLEAKVQHSTVASRFAAYAYRAEVAMAPMIEQLLDRSLNNLAVSPETGELVKLPYTIANAKPQPKLEEQMLELLNQERATYGLRPLQADTALRTVARQHSADMFRRGYFSHNSPDGDNVGDRVREAGIPFSITGENLALAATLSIAHQGLMNSPGHRANILQKRYNRVGIGIMKGGPGKLMITQNFRN